MALSEASVIEQVDRGAMIHRRGQVLEGSVYESQPDLGAGIKQVDEILEPGDGQALKQKARQVRAQVALEQSVAAQGVTSGRLPVGRRIGRGHARDLAYLVERFGRRQTVRHE
jgi:hypothetical protein